MLGVLPGAVLSLASMSFRQHCQRHWYFPQEELFSNYSKRKELPPWLSIEQQSLSTRDVFCVFFVSREHVPAGESLPHKFPSDLFLVNREIGEMRGCLEEINEPTCRLSQEHHLPPLLFASSSPQNTSHKRVLLGCFLQCLLYYPAPSAFQELLNDADKLYKNYADKLHRISRPDFQALSLPLACDAQEGRSLNIPQPQGLHL